MENESLIDLIMRGLIYKPSLVQRCGSGVMGKYINFQIESKRFFILIDDKYRDYGNWLLNFLFRTKEHGDYMIYEGDYNHSKWGYNILHEEVKNGAIRLERLRMFEDIKKPDENAELESERNAIRKGQDLLETYFKKLLEESENGN